MTPEEQLILSCLHSIVSGQPMGELPAVDWGHVFQLAEVNRVLPILQSTVPEDAIPAPFSTRLNDSARRLRMRAAVMIDEFQRIRDELEMAAIVVIPIKGIAISQMAYPSPSMRYFDDLDLLVREEAGRDALAILSKLGYEPHPNAPRPEWHHLAPYIHRKRGTMVEIHVDLVRWSRKEWGIDDIWDRSVSGKLKSKSNRLLSTEDNLINAALHARHNLYRRISSFLDIALLINIGEDERDFSEKLSRMAEDAGASCALGYCLDMAGRLLNIEKLPEIECTGLRRRISYQVGDWNSLAPKNASLKQGPLPRITELFLMDSLRDSLSLSARLVAPPLSFIESDGENERTPLFSYVHRFGSRLRQAAKQIGQMIRGE